MNTSSSPPSASADKSNDPALLDLLNLSRDDSDVMDSETSYFQTNLSPTENESPEPFETSEMIPFDSACARTPPRIMSSSTLLYGEDLIATTRLSANSYLAPRLSLEAGLSDDDEEDADEEDDNESGENHHHQEGDEPDLLFSPSLQSAQASEATTPPSIACAPSLSPPLLNTSSTAQHPAEAPSFSSRNSKQQQQQQQQQQKRPPRAPIVNLRVSDSHINNWTASLHVRAGSTGEGSLLSALTDSSGEPFRPGARENHEGIDIAIATDLQQPILNEQELKMEEAPDFSDSRANHSVLYHNIEKSPASRKQPVLSTAVAHHEYEVEARQNIMKAIEQMRGDDSPIFPCSWSEERLVDEKQLSYAEENLASLIQEYYSVQTSRTEGFEKQKVVRSRVRSAISERKPWSSGEIFSGTLSLLMRTGQPSQSEDSVDEESIPLTTSADSDRKRPTGELEAAERGNSTCIQPPTRGSKRQLGVGWSMLEDALRSYRKDSVYDQIRNILFWVVVPSLMLSVFLFYGAGNPPTGIRSSDTVNKVDPAEASLSWWFLFVGVRHTLMLLLARVTEHAIMAPALSNPTIIKLLGTSNVLVVSMSRGWPFVLLFYGFYCLAFLFGSESLMQHWLYWQTSIGLLNAENPSGDVTIRCVYLRFLVSCIFVGACVTIKRLLLGYQFNKWTRDRYCKRVVHLLKQMTLISELASLSVDSQFRKFSENVTSLYGSMHLSPVSPSNRNETRSGTETRNQMDNSLEEWQEPSGHFEKKSVTLRDIFEFHCLCELLGDDFPFSLAFGDVKDRASCAKSAAEVFDRLAARLGRTHDMLNVEAICSLLSARSNQRRHPKELSKLWQTDKSGNISQGDFVKSLDSVYREMRIVAEGLMNEAVLARSLENIANAIVCTFVAMTTSFVLDINTLPLVLTIAAVFCASALLFGPMCSSYFRGIVFIAGTRSFDIGDHVTIGRVDEDTRCTGNSGWLIEGFDLFNTTIRSNISGERATIANGVLSEKRIANMRLSDCVYLRIPLKVGINVSSETAKIFRLSVENYLHNRDRKWVGLRSFQASKVESSLACVEYVLEVQARGSWQEFHVIQKRKEALSNYCLELKRQLGMLCSPPRIPVDISGAASLAGSVENRTDFKKNKGLGTSLGVINDPGIVSDSAVSVDEGLAHIAGLFESKKGW